MNIYFGSFFEENQKISKVSGICLWDDIIEFGGEESWQYSNSYLPALARGIQDRQPEVHIKNSIFF